MDCAISKTEKPVLPGEQISKTADTRLNPEDIELARKRAELALYLEKADELEKEYEALRRNLIEFRDRFYSLLGPEGNRIGLRPSAGIELLAAHSKAQAAEGRALKERTANAYLPLIEAVRDELSSDVLTALLDRNIVDGRKITHATISQINGTAPAHYAEKPIPDTCDETGAALIAVIRRIYSTRERILLLHRGIMKLRYSVLNKFMTAVREKDE